MFLGTLEPACNGRSVSKLFVSFSTGSAGPAFFGLGLRETLIVLTVVDIT